MKGKILVSLTILIGLLIFYSSTDKFNLLLIIITTEIVGLIYYRLNLLNPFVWLSPFLVIYNISVVILDVIGIRYSNHSLQILSCTYTAQLTLFIFCFLFIKKNLKNKIDINWIETRKTSSLFKISSILLLLYVPIFIKTGYTSKQDANLNGGLFGYGIISQAFIYFYIINVIITCIKLKRFPIRTLIIGLSISLSISLVIGERDVFLAILLLSFLIYYYFFSISRLKIIVIGFCGVCLIPILGATKQITNKSEISIGNNSIIENILSGEFLSSGRNIETLMQNHNAWSYKYGESILTDLSRSIIPSTIYPVKNSTGWFNDKFNERASEGFGYGFSYVGEGYIQGNQVGIVIWILILGVIIKFLYDRSQRNIIFMTAYLFLIPIIIYSMRGDLSYIISPLLKQVIPLSLIVKYYCKKNNNINSKACTISKKQENPQLISY